MSSHDTRSPSGVDDGDLVALALAGLGPAAAGNYRRGLDDFARFRRADPPGAALRELIGLPHGPANRLVADYRADLEARGLAPGTIANRLSMLRGAVRRARLAGRTTLALDVAGPRVGRGGSAAPPRPVMRRGRRILAIRDDCRVELGSDRSFDIVIAHCPIGSPVQRAGRVRRTGRLNRAQYRVIEALIDAWPDGLTGPELFQASGSGAYRNVLRGLVARDETWRALIRFPGTTRGERYRIAYPG